jgi:hypothetical protein
MLAAADAGRPAQSDLCYEWADLTNKRPSTIGAIMAPRRFLLVIGILVLVAIFIVVGLFAYDEFFSPMPGFCADYSSPSLAPAGCHKSVALYVAGLLVIGGAIGALWRRLGR